MPVAGAELLRSMGSGGAAVSWDNSGAPDVPGVNVAGLGAAAGATAVGAGCIAGSDCKPGDWLCCLMPGAPALIHWAIGDGWFKSRGIDMEVPYSESCVASETTLLRAPIAAEATEAAALAPAAAPLSRICSC